MTESKLSTVVVPVSATVSRRPVEPGWLAIMGLVRDHMQRLKAHPSKTVVLLPFFQLQPVARQAWVQSLTDSAAQANCEAWCSFMPRFETTKSWHQRLAHHRPDAVDVSFDTALDMIRARCLLRQAGLGQHVSLLAPRLLHAAHQLAAVAASVAPAQRAEWADKLRVPLGGQGEHFAVYEAAVARIALEWAAASRYASDVLFEETAPATLDALVVVEGVLPQPLAQRLALMAGNRVLRTTLPSRSFGALFIHKASHFEDEAQRAAACVLAHIGQGRWPVALAAVDRQLTRRISALLDQSGASVCDETGWKLSTTRSAASVMSLLHAAGHAAGDAEHLQWLQACAVQRQALHQWERAIRAPNRDAVLIRSAREAIRFTAETDPSRADWMSLLRSLMAPRSVAEWLQSTQQALKISGQWQALEADPAGQQVIAALHWNSPQAQAVIESDVSRIKLADFCALVQAALEAAVFKPADLGCEPHVVVLPLAQLAARPFACVVIPAADDARLPAAAPAVGDWTAAQRSALALPSGEDMALQEAKVWCQAMQFACIDVLWSESDGAQSRLPSPLLQAWLLDHPSHTGADTRDHKLRLTAPTQRPEPSALGLRLEAPLLLSASSYADLRACPYRYFALRLLQFEPLEAVHEEVSKRDFGSWVHAVLSRFHRQRRHGASAQADFDLVNACAQQEEAVLQAQPGFFPFAAAWPVVRDNYLDWLAGHERCGWQFESSEHAMQRSLDDVVVLRGRLDRIDVLAGSGSRQLAVIDYKTEAVDSLHKRVKEPLEDTQLMFYAALMGGDALSPPLRAMYVPLAEKPSKPVENVQLPDALPIWLDGLVHDVRDVISGHRLMALGEGKACEYCAARGLCRRDFWSHV